MYLDQSCDNLQGKVVLIKFEKNYENKIDTRSKEKVITDELN